MKRCDNSKSSHLFFPGYELLYCCVEHYCMMNFFDIIFPSVCLANKMYIPSAH